MWFLTDSLIVSNMKRFAADYKFMQNLLPSNNYSIGGSISLNQDPVIKLTDEQALHLQDDFHRLRDRMDNCHLLFHRELMGSLCLTMMYDIFEAHAQRESTDSHTDRTAYIVKQLMTLHSLTSAATAPSILASPPVNTDRVFNRNNTRSSMMSLDKRLYDCGQNVCIRHTFHLFSLILINNNVKYTSNLPNMLKDATSDHNKK